MVEELLRRREKDEERSPGGGMGDLRLEKGRGLTRARVEGSWSRDGDKEKSIREEG